MFLIKTEFAIEWRQNWYFCSWSKALYFSNPSQLRRASDWNLTQGAESKKLLIQKLKATQIIILTVIIFDFHCGCGCHGPRDWQGDKHLWHEGGTPAASQNVIFIAYIDMPLSSVWKVHICQRKNYFVVWYVCVCVSTNVLYAWFILWFPLKLKRRLVFSISLPSLCVNLLLFHCFHLCWSIPTSQDNDDSACHWRRLRREVTGCSSRLVG